MSLREQFGKNFRYEENENCFLFFGSMYEDMMDKFGTGKEALICEKPELPCDPAHFAGWLAMNALAYGFRKGLAAADFVMEVRYDD